MPATVQLNTRIDPEVKRRGDAVFAREGLTSSEVVRAVWQAAAETQQVPECVMHGARKDRSQRIKAIEEAAGIATRIAEDMGVRLSHDPTPIDYHALRDELYDDLIARMEATHA